METQRQVVGNDKEATVYVVGAEFSSELGFPMADRTLIELCARVRPSLKERIVHFIEHNNFKFDLSRGASYPSLETFLAKIMVMEHWTTAVSAQVSSPFSHEFLVSLRRDVLLAVTKWFYELQRSVTRTPPEWLSAFVGLILKNRSTVISFNWDLTLDQLLFGAALDRHSYGFAIPPSIPALLKPRGSLNWYESDSLLGRKDNCFRLCGVGEQLVQARKDFKMPQFSLDSLSMPLILPATYLNDVGISPFKETGIGCIERIGAADRVVFLGYSMPQADLHARSILRWGFHNNARDRQRPCEFIVVNSDEKAISRTIAVVGRSPPGRSKALAVSSWVLSALG